MESELAPFPELQTPLLEELDSLSTVVIYDWKVSRNSSISRIPFRDLQVQLMCRNHKDRNTLSGFYLLGRSLYPKHCMQLLPQNQTYPLPTPTPLLYVALWSHKLLYPKQKNPIDRTLTVQACMLIPNLPSSI